MWKYAEEENTKKTKGFIDRAIQRGRIASKQVRRKANNMYDKVTNSDIYNKIKDTGKNAYNSYMSALKGDPTVEKRLRQSMSSYEKLIEEADRFAPAGKKTEFEQKMRDWYVDNLDKSRKEYAKHLGKKWGARLGTGAVAGGAALYGGKKIYDAISGD